jgi:toxin CcdB
VAQFDVYRNPDASSRKRFPLLLDIQAQLLDELATRVVVPLAVFSEKNGSPISRLMPVLDFEGKAFVMHTPELAGVARKALGEKIGSLAAQRLAIVDALDVLISGV